MSSQEQQNVASFLMKTSFQSKTVNLVTESQYQKNSKNNITFGSPIYTLSLAGNITVCRPSQGTNR